jgi:Insertion element 4 transposase N-terminal
MKPVSTLPLADARMTAFVSLAALVQACPRRRIDATLADSDAAGLRERALPPWAVAYCVMSFALWPQASSEAVLQAVAEGLGLISGLNAPTLQAGKSALSQARQRLGAEPLRRLARQTLQPLAGPGQAGAWFRDWRVVSLHQRLLAMPDTPANARHFGRPPWPWHSNATGPLARLLTLAEGATFVPVAAHAAPSQEELDSQVMAFLHAQRPAGSLLLAEQPFGDSTLLPQMLASGGPAVCQIGTKRRPPIDRMLPDGSYLSQAADGRTVRVIGYTLQPTDLTPTDASFLVTNLLDPGDAPALGLVELFDRTLARPRHAGLPRDSWPAGPLRSKSPGMAMQELWGLVLAEYAIRRLGGTAMLAD